MLESHEKDLKVGAMKRPDWLDDREWADAFWPEIERVIRGVAGDIADVRLASVDEDRKSATDYIVTVSSGDIACRIRRKGKWKGFGDFTVRAWRKSGHETELAKLQRGFGRWYLYAWAENEHFGAWIFLDLDVLRESGLLGDDRQIIKNPDGRSGFKAYSLIELCNARCIVRSGGAASGLGPG